MPNYLIVYPGLPSTVDEDCLEEISEESELADYGKVLAWQVEKKERQDSVHIVKIPSDIKMLHCLDSKIPSPDVIYIVGHCNGSSFGSRNIGHIDFSPIQMADWINKWLFVYTSDKPLIIKLSSCDTGTPQEEFDYKCYAKIVSENLARPDIFVRGYIGSIAAARINGSFHTTSNIDGVVYRASEKSVTYSHKFFERSKDFWSLTNIALGSQAQENDEKTNEDMDEDIDMFDCAL